MRVVLCLLTLMMGWIVSVSAGDLVVKPDSRIEVLYIHAGDCPYCRNWQLHTQKRFLKTPAAQHVDIITIDKGRIRYTLKANDYPEGYQHLHQRDPDFGKRVPAWWLLVDRQPVLWKNGEANWDTMIEPTILDLVAKKVAGGGTLSGVIP